MNKSMLTLAAAMLLGAAATQAEVREVSYSYAQPNAEAITWGTKKAETYDVAIQLNDGGMAGAKVKSFSCPLATKNVTGISAWATLGEPKLDKDGNNVADFSATSAGLDASNVLQATFATPVEIPSDGLIVGFSFTVDNITEDNKMPLVIVSGRNPEGFWLHASRSYLKWRTMEQQLRVVPITVVIEGDFSDNCVAINSIEPVSTEAGAPFVMQVGLSNYGKEPVSSIEYTIEMPDGSKTPGSLTLDTPVGADFASKGVVEIPVSPLYSEGVNDVTITVDKVNGKENVSPNKSAVGKATVVGFLAVTRPLMEEYTGLWCGACPRGYIAMERMKELYGDRFVCLSYHANSRDPLECFKDRPTYINSYPNAVLNRETQCDPYYGLNTRVDFGIREDWEKLAQKVVDVDVYCTLEWADDSHTTVRCNSALRFVNDFNDADYKVTYCLVADGIETVDGEKLEQHNYYQNDPTHPEDDWSVFVKGGDVVPLVYNDIAVAFDNMHGIDGSVPTSVEYGRVYYHSYDYAFPIKNIYDVTVVDSADKLRCVALVFTGDGKFVNCATSKYLGQGELPQDSIPSIVGDDASPVVDSVYYDLNGRRVNRPGKGLWIRVDRHADGTQTPVKIVL